MSNRASDKTAPKDKGFSCQCQEASYKGPEDNFRRDMLKYMTLAIPVANLALAGSASAAEKPERLPPQPGDRLTYFSKKKRGQIIKVSDLNELDKQQLILPFDTQNEIVRDGSRYNQILLQKLPEGDLSEKTKALSANGIVAYSAICTHAGCPVTGWVSDDEHYMCPCHQSVFNPKDSGVVMSGPAPRNLPALPLAIDGDEIVVAGSFNSWIGFGKPRR
ncbi:Rieske 2Fe-2S domain-containing protein [Alteromonas sp. C1M14]|uniref:QcrA and Rieske domain-containing protein n=1 Tax=Alteromonas sp. C1M14 TaxID=2841567 RepID=UPI001C080957|nr:Rieske 2Fe-2S domain-containing protein [Alteromonas sp. C1M14]MBU2978484.1 Rieske 2Fe-2S domain-containing protein [Alteromonas sp. C1M14]